MGGHPNVASAVDAPPFAGALFGAVLMVAGALAGCANGGGPSGGFGGLDATAPVDARAGGDAHPQGANDSGSTSDDAAPSEDAGGTDATATDATVGDDASDGGGEGSVVIESDAPSGDITPDSGADLEAGEAGDGAGDDASDASPPVDAAPDEGAPIVDAAPDAPLPCGGCSSGFTCGASSYCRTSTGVPAFGHVYVILLDNQPLSAIKGSSSAPYLNGLMNAHAYATAYTTSVHPSLPNLVDLTSGNPQNIGCDCSPGATNTCNTLNCTDIAQACSCPVAVTHLGDELDLAVIPWREYAESMGAPCNASVDAGTTFAANHVPFLYYADVYGDSARCTERVRDFGDFAGDLAGGTYRFSLVSPNLCDDMHGCGSGDAVKAGDDWLAAHVPAILTTPGFAAGGSDVLFIVADEPDMVSALPLPFVVVSPLAKKGTTAGAYTHESLLTTIEDGLGLPRLGNTAALAPIADVWR
jgi:hypothetical protein